MLVVSLGRDGSADARPVKGAETLSEAGPPAARREEDTWPATCFLTCDVTEVMARVFTVSPFVCAVAPHSPFHRHYLTFAFPPVARFYAYLCSLVLRVCPYFQRIHLEFLQNCPLRPPSNIFFKAGFGI